MAPFSESTIESRIFDGRRRQARDGAAVERHRGQFGNDEIPLGILGGPQRTFDWIRNAFHVSSASEPIGGFRPVLQPRQRLVEASGDEAWVAELAAGAPFQVDLGVFSETARIDLIGDRTPDRTHGDDEISLPPGEPCCLDKILGGMDELIPGRFRAKPVLSSQMLEICHRWTWDRRRHRAELGRAHLLLDFDFGEVDRIGRQQLGEEPRWKKQPSGKQNGCLRASIPPSADEVRIGFGEHVHNHGDSVLTMAGISRMDQPGWACAPGLTEPALAGRLRLPFNSVPIQV
jgi:hypothetical protein